MLLERHTLDIREISDLVAMFFALSHTADFNCGNQTTNLVVLKRIYRIVQFCAKKQINTNVLVSTRSHVAIGMAKPLWITVPVIFDDISQIIVRTCSVVSSFARNRFQNPQQHLVANTFYKTNVGQRTPKELVNGCASPKHGPIMSHSSAGFLK